MNRGLSAGVGMAAMAASFAAGAALAQDWGDSPYVPTPMNVVERMLEVAKVGPGDFVIDLGSGDGRMVITAAKKHGARGFGVDIDRKLVAIANRNAAKEGVAGRAVFYERDLHATDISKATVMSLYLLPEVNLMIRHRLLDSLRPGTRIVAHDYGMGTWPVDYQEEIDAPGKKVGLHERSKILYWVVPGRAAGRWQWRLAPEGKPVDFELALQQSFQMIEGTLASDGRKTAVGPARLEGERIAFNVALEGAKYEYTGRIVNHAIEGKVRITGKGPARELPWSAARVEIWPPHHASITPEEAVRELN